VRTADRPGPFGIFDAVKNTPPGALPLPVVPGLVDLEFFARGGYATVYRATQRSVGREVAVKVENRSLGNERDQRRFMREARAAGRMSSHPHVVDLFDVGVTEDQHPYLIMEMCDGSYADRMRDSPLGAAEARDVGVKIADALADAHQLGVLHRDVKPANILYSRFNEPALADFGLAIIAETRDPTVTMEILTPAYAPPEMFSHHPPASAVDVYALCATLYAIMNGRPPRWENEPNPSLIRMMELFARPIPELPGIPTVLTDVLRIGMANDPAARPSVGRGADQSVRSDATAVGAGPHPGRPTPTPAAGTSIGEHPTVPTGRRPRRLRWFLGGLGAVALLLGVASASWYATSDLPDPTSDLPDPTPTSSVTGAPTTSGPATSQPVNGALGGCLVPLPGGGRCPAELECFAPVRLGPSGTRAERVPCRGRHTWETYAEGELSEGIDITDHEAVRADPVVRQVCNEHTFRVTTLLMDTSGWRFEVLPPGGNALVVGDRTFRCLAGRGVDQLAEPALGG
jgi:serine/threonine protein kinase